MPAGTLRTLLAGGSIRLVYAGFALEPALRDGETFVTRTGGVPRSGDLALCAIGGWCDVRRLVNRDGRGGWVTALDALPRAREVVPADAILGIVESVGTRGRPPRRPAWSLPAWSRVAAAVSWIRRLRAIPDFDERAGDSVRLKYAQQVDQYSALLLDDVPAPLGRLLLPALPSGGSILVAGSGAGGEAIALARRGYAVTGVDFVPAMVEAARRHAEARGAAVAFLEAEISTLDLGARRFDAAYVTPMVYSFIPTRARRVAALRALSRHLEPHGTLVFSAALLTRPLQWAEVAALWLARCATGRKEHEFGDWLTSFLTPAGVIDTSFLHRTWKAEVRREARAAGFRRVRWAESGYFVASIAGQNGASFRK